MTNPIFDEFYRVIVPREKYRARGFINIDCPACGDKRSRGGFAPTPTGGFRYSCYNGGCEYNTRATGWEPGNGLNGRIRRLFDLLGGNIKNIPIKEIMTRRRNLVYDAKGNVIGHEDELDIARRFPEMALPTGSNLLAIAAKQYKNAADCAQYVTNRSPLFWDKHEFMWSPKYPRHVIVPYYNYSKIVGYLGRNIDVESGQGRFIQRAPDDYLFNQHLVNSMPGEYVLVNESPFDAILIDGIASRGTKLTTKQINFLRVCGKNPIMIPDMRGNEWEPYVNIAEENNWLISIPEWGKHKDVGESIQANGLLCTLELVYRDTTTNYTKARVLLNSKSKK